MDAKHIIIFAPIGVRDGMAAAKRIGNLVEFIKPHHHVINLYEDTKVVNEELNDITYQSYTSLKEERSSLKKISQQNKGQKLIYYYYGYPTLQNIFNLLQIKAMGYHIFFDIVEDHRVIVQYKKGMLKKANLLATVWLLKWSKLFASGYIGISEHLYGMLNSFFHKKKPVLLLPISVNPFNFPTPAYGTQPQKISFFYGGSYAPKDDFDVMLQAFVKIYKDHADKIDSFYLSGKCPPAKYQEIMELAKKNNINCIRFLGFLTDEEYYQYIRQVNVLVMPRNNSDFANTGFPFKLGEYMATGNCVISARLTPVVQTVGEQALIYYTPEDLESLSNAFISIIDNPSLLKQNGHYARETAFKIFNAQEHSSALSAFFQTAS